MDPISSMTGTLSIARGLRSKAVFFPMWVASLLLLLALGSYLRSGSGRPSDGAAATLRFLGIHADWPQSTHDWLNDASRVDTVILTGTIVGIALMAVLGWATARAHDSMHLAYQRRPFSHPSPTLVSQMLRTSSSVLLLAALLLECDALGGLLCLVGLIAASLVILGYVHRHAEENLLEIWLETMPLAILVLVAGLVSLPVLLLTLATGFDPLFQPQDPE